MFDSAEEAYSVGVDLEEISRFKRSKITNSVSFLNRVFTQKELDYCYSSQIPAQHLAAKFAGKEAVFKALSALGGGELAYREIQILNDSKGIPCVTIQREGFSDISINISLSHTQGLAVAFVIATRPKVKTIKK